MRMYQHKAYRCKHYAPHSSYAPISFKSHAKTYADQRKNWTEINRMLTNYGIGKLLENHGKNWNSLRIKGIA